jgi:hypothetical protein
MKAELRQMELNLLSKDGLLLEKERRIKELESKVYDLKH